MKTLALLLFLLIPSLALAQTCDGLTHSCGCYCHTELGQSISLRPNRYTVEVGGEFDIQAWIPVAGDTINGVQFTVIYDESLVEAVDITNGDMLSPNGVGPYMMAAACGGIFNALERDTNLVNVSVIPMCAGTKLTGPGHIYTLRFRAKPEGVGRTVTFDLVQFSYDPQWPRYPRETQFYHGGFLVTPVLLMEDTAVEIAGVTGVAPITRPADGKVYDVMGRRVDPGNRSGVVFGAKKRVVVK